MEKRKWEGEEAGASHHRDSKQTVKMNYSKPIVVLINCLVFFVFLHKVIQVFKCHHLEVQIPLCFYS